jgi:transposase
MNKDSPQKPVFTSRRMEQQWSRIQAVKMVRSGHSVDEVAELFKVSRRAVYQWLSAFADSGQNGLLAKDGAGRPPKVNDEQMRWIAMTVRDNTPHQLQLESGPWTLRLVGQLIERQFDIKLSLPTLGKLMAQLGFTPQRPLRRACEQYGSEKHKTTLSG